MACKRSPVRPRYSPPSDDLRVVAFFVACTTEPVTDKPSFSKEGLGGLSISNLCAKRTGSTPVFSTKRRPSGCRFFVACTTEPVTDKPSFSKEGLGGLSIWKMCAKRTGSTPVFSTKKDTICSCPFFVENKYRHSLLNPPFDLRSSSFAPRHSWCKHHFALGLASVDKGRTCYLTPPLRGRRTSCLFLWRIPTVSQSVSKFAFLGFLPYLRRNKPH